MIGGRFGAIHPPIFDMMGADFRGCNTSKKPCRKQAFFDNCSIDEASSIFTQLFRYQLNASKNSGIHKDEIVKS
jgi:hypothetical protein